ncbi:hypothetical protein ACHAXS_012104 [Conticribra weissflogii]
MGQRQSSPAHSPNEVKGNEASEATARKSSVSQNSVDHDVNHKIGIALERQSNPSTEDSRSHNFGQPMTAPHSLPAEESDETMNKSKFVTDCRVHHRASLQCIEENYENRQHACASFFDAYKQCRKEEHERKLEANAKRSGFW